MADKSKRAFRTISEVAGDLNVPQHVLRFWETKFTQIKPMKRGGNRRYYRPDDILLLKAIQHSLYDEGMTIKGAQKVIKDSGVRKFVAAWKKKAGYKEPKEAAKPAPKVTPPKEKAKPKAPPAPPKAPAPAAADDDHIRVSKDLVKALVADLKALRAVIDKLPDK